MPRSRQDTERQRKIREKLARVLKDAIKTKGTSAKEAAQKIQMERSKFYLILEATKSIPIEKALDLADFLSIPSSQIEEIYGAETIDSPQDLSMEEIFDILSALSAHGLKGKHLLPVLIDPAYAKRTAAIIKANYGE